jgi:hypothetical protein
MTDRSKQLDALLEKFALAGLSEEEQERVRSTSESIEAETEGVIAMIQSAVADREGKEMLLREIARRVNG